MKRLQTAALCTAAIFYMVSCSQAPKSDEAEVSEAQEVTLVEPEATFGIVKEASELTWVGTKPNGRHNGTIDITNGDIAVKEGEIVGGNFVIDLNQIDVLDLEGEDKQKLTNHLKSNDFFDVEKNPKAEFVITSVEDFTADNTADNENTEESEFKLENPTHKITGNLSMRDSTLSISFPARVEMMDDKLTAEAKFNIDRTRWGVSFRDESKVADKTVDNFIYNTVHVGFHIEAAK